MIVLNEALPKVRVPAYTRFGRVGYSQLGSISALLKGKSKAGEVIKDHSNALLGPQSQ